MEVPKKLKNALDNEINVDTDKAELRLKQLTKVTKE